MNNTELTDTYRHKGLREKLVADLRKKGIISETVLQAISIVPRHYFFDTTFIEYAYQDKAFPIDAGQTISQPYTVAAQTELLDVKSGMKVLEVGTGSGYQACILATIGAKVYSIERQKLLFEKAKILLPKLTHRIRLFYGDGYAGLPVHAPFDRILITAAAPFIPQKLLEQLKIGGIIVAPVGEGDTQVMTRIIRKSETEFVKNEFGIYRFVPMLAKKAEDR